MKNLKVVLNFLPVVLIVAATYFFTSGFSMFETPSKATNKIKTPNVVNTENTSTNCTWFVIFQDASNAGCEGPYTYCINGGNPITVTDEVLQLDLPCGSTYTVCVKAAKGDCFGTTTIVNSCNPCDYNVRPLNMYPSPLYCNCAND